MKTMTLTSLSEAIPNEDIFAHMVSAGLSFIPSATVADYLDSEYFANCSGTKQASPLVEKWSGQPDCEQKLAAMIVNRYRAKWEGLFRQYSNLSTLNLLNNISLTKSTTYGKSNTTSTSNTLTKSGSEVNTLNGEQVTDETFPDARKSTRKITGGWEGTDNATNTRTGTEETTESFPTERKSSKSTTGGYSDADTTKNTRTGSQLVTEKGDTLASVYGFNSSSPVPSTKSGPADSQTGTTSETTYGQNGLIDERSGSISRTYSNFKEETTESGSKKLAVTYGQDGLVDQTDSTNSRTYNNYQDELTESGSRRTRVSYGQGGKTDTLSFNNRSDSNSGSSTSTDSGTDSATEQGYNYKSLIDEYLAIFCSAEYMDFIAIVYADCDEVLTCPFYV